jgi:hypothetical protein
MRHKSIGIKLGATETILTVPSDRKAKMISLYISNTDLVDQSASVYIQKDGSSDNIYLIKNALIPVQAALQAVSNEVFLGPDDIVVVETSEADKLDCFLSYYEIIVHEGFL